MLLRTNWVKEEIKDRLKRYIKANKKNTVYQNFWDAANVGIRRKFLLLQIYVKIKEKSLKT